MRFFSIGGTPVLQGLKERARRLKLQLTVLYYAYRDPKLPWFAKLPIAAAMLYALSPIDLIPDFIPVLGYLDDLIVLPALIALALFLIPPAVLEKAEGRAREEPLLLKKKWAFALLFLCIWLFMLAALIKFLLTLF